MIWKLGPRSCIFNTGWGTPISTPKYSISYYGDLRRGIPNFGNPHFFAKKCPSNECRRMVGGCCTLVTYWVHSTTYSLLVGKKGIVHIGLIYGVYSLLPYYYPPVSLMRHHWIIFCKASQVGQHGQRFGGRGEWYVIGDSLGGPPLTL